MSILCVAGFTSKRLQKVIAALVRCTEDAEVLQLLLNDRGPEGVATWARDADMKLAVEIVCGGQKNHDWTIWLSINRSKVFLQFFREILRRKWVWVWQTGRPQQLWIWVDIEGPPCPRVLEVTEDKKQTAPTYNTTAGTGMLPGEASSTAQGHLWDSGCRPSPQMDDEICFQNTKPKPLNPKS